MLLAAALGFLSSQGDAKFAKDLAKIVDSKAVVYLRSEIKDDDENRNYRFTFLDAKGSIVGELIGPDHLCDVKISPDGSLAVACFYDRYTEDDIPRCSYVVADKTGEVANLKDTQDWSVTWKGNDLVLYGTRTPLTKWGPDNTNKTWSQHKISDIHTRTVLIDGDSLWAEEMSSDESKPYQLVHLAADGTVIKQIPTDHNPHDLLAVISDPSVVIMNSLEDVSLDLQTFQRLSAWDVAKGTETVVSKRMRYDMMAWLSGVSQLGFLAQLDQNRCQMAFYSPSTGKAKPLGPDRLEYASCAALNSDTALVVAQVDSSMHMYLMTPSTGTCREMKLTSVPSPDLVSGCH